VAFLIFYFEGYSAQCILFCEKSFCETKNQLCVPALCKSIGKSMPLSHLNCTAISDVFNKIKKIDTLGTSEMEETLVKLCHIKYGIQRAVRGNQRDVRISRGLTRCGY
jgi:hypothetical protein